MNGEIKHLIFLLFLLLISLITTTTVTSDSIGVSPGKLVFDNVDNSNKEFTIYNPNKNDFEFNVYSEPLEWIKFTPESGTIEPGGKIKVSAKLNVPKKTKSGEYNTFIYVNPDKNNDNVTLIKTGAAIKAEIRVTQGIKPSLMAGLMIIITIIVLGVAAYKKINIFR